MIVLIAAVLLGIVMLLIGFGLNYVRFLGGHQEQNTATEAAALAAAGDISRIAINTDEFGWVSLSDAAPIGKTTTAGDKYYLPVYGINTLVGTARLDYIIGLYLKNTVMQNLALADLASTKKVVTKLDAVLQNAVKKGGSGTDLDGKAVTPWTDAQTAYTDNQIRMTGSANYVNGSMKLTLGCLSQGIPTNVQVPQPQSGAFNDIVNPADQYNGFYLSDKNIPVGGQAFVFGAVTAGTRLVDPVKFSTNPGLPYQINAVVKAEADELLRNSQNPGGLTVHNVACAAASNVYDPKPAPGSFTVSFPDGPPSEMQSPIDLLTHATMTASNPNTSIQTPIGGDYPGVPNGNLTDTEMPGPSPWAGMPVSNNCQDITAPGIYDWVRRAGTKANISALNSMLNSQFDPPGGLKVWVTAANSPPLPGSGFGPKNPFGPVRYETGTTWVNASTLMSFSGAMMIPRGIMHVYKWASDGSIDYASESLIPFPYPCMSQNQMYGECLKAIPKSGSPLISFIGVTLPGDGGQQGGWGDGGGNGGWGNGNNGGGGGGGQSSSCTGDITLSQQYDLYVRDQVRQPGQNKGGAHGGEPLAGSADWAVSIVPTNPYNAALCSDFISGGLGCKKGGGSGGSGGGALPVLGAETDFNEAMNVPGLSAAPYVTYITNPGGSGVRPTYQTNGSVVDIRFRRKVDVVGQCLVSVLLPGAVTPTITNNTVKAGGYMGLEQ